MDEKTVKKPRAKKATTVCAKKTEPCTCKKENWFKRLFSRLFSKG